MVRVLVTDAARGSAIAFIRSLGRHGVQVIAADHRSRSPGFRSRYACERLVYPDPAVAPEASIEELLDAAQRRRVDLIVPVTDEVLLPLSAARERFAGVCALALPDPDGARRRDGQAGDARARAAARRADAADRGRAQRR